MGRPKNDQLNISIEQRIEEAFWTLSEKNPIERISVVALSKEAHCNRGTFYYYFTDIYELLDRIIEKNIPTKLPNYLQAAIAGSLREEDIKAAILAERDRIDRLASLLSRSTSPYTNRRLKNSAIKVWAKAMGMTTEDLSSTDRLFFEFMASGLFGALAYHAEHPQEASYEELIHALLPVIPAITVAYFGRTGRTVPSRQLQEEPTAEDAAD
ncbi:MAG: TetR/AcrR family transcriptional regulator [Coriobacteriia bacterium]|nr:TetR/AcrR family transcriptional regulator [Coriobacteriia bacterium]